MMTGLNEFALKKKKTPTNLLRRLQHVSVEIHPYFKDIITVLQIALLRTESQSKNIIEIIKSLVSRHPVV